jgi:hypothetical protein
MKLVDLEDAFYQNDCLHIVLHIIDNKCVSKVGRKNQLFIMLC